jgi:hypothetical protein
MILRADLQADATAAVVDLVASKFNEKQFAIFSSEEQQVSCRLRASVPRCPLGQLLQRLSRIRHKLAKPPSLF